MFIFKTCRLHHARMLELLWGMLCFTQILVALDLTLLW